MIPSSTASRLCPWVVALLFTVLLFASCTPDASEQPGATDLYILSPHGSDIRREFGEAFSRWHLQHYHAPVNVRWTDIGAGGTGTIAKYLETLYRSSNSSNNDLVFGGGSAQFSQYAAAGFLVPPLALAADDPVFKQDPIDAVPADLFGQPLKDPGHLWIAATMSSFGIEINKQRIAELGLPTPRRWEDIATPGWQGRLSLADPSKSGSVKTSYEQIFQQYGWEKGWAVLTRIFANASVVRDGGSNPAEDVGSADAVGGIVIDFFGRIHITRAGPGIVGFIIPEGGSALDADPIGILKGAPHPEIAARFLRFTISPEGQRLWTFKPNGGKGTMGPRKTALGRLSILPGLYETESQNMLDPANPFTSTKPLVTDATYQKIRNPFMGDLIKSTLIDNQKLLAETRCALHQAGDPADLMVQLEAPPTFTPSTINSYGALSFGAAEPITTARQAAVGEEFTGGGGRTSHVEQLQAHLRNHWRDSYQQRLAGLLAAAHSRIGR